MSPLFFIIRLLFLLLGVRVFVSLVSSILVLFFSFTSFAGTLSIISISIDRLLSSVCILEGNDSIFKTLSSILISFSSDPSNALPFWKSSTLRSTDASIFPSFVFSMLLVSFRFLFLVFGSGFRFLGDVVIGLVGLPDLILPVGALRSLFFFGLSFSGFLKISNSKN